ncbi:replication initiation protein [Clostridium tagluense]|uniref:replication initiation protein n=1 Tax=Clostridium tagluense TaxID=360422 RepID=UPI001C6EB6FA|nr:replication initiation protein [Clostridium tagluense]MBW9159521.1 replication initiation protein [Clostridium tagluense]WLC68520.1 replication initiation protein [Clostridium tagluense]
MATDLQNINDNWIYQSNKLIEASHSFSVLEQKLIRLLASMIKKDDVDLKKYQFKAIDLSEILGIHRKNIYKELDKVTDKLMLRVIKVKNNQAEKFKKYHLIKNADFENGILTMKIDEEMKEFYLELKQYTKYQLRNIMQFKSTYSFRIYELLKQYEKIGNRIVTIYNLRSALDINTSQYPKYSNLKQKVIKIAINEINNNTDLHIECEELKESRKVTSIKFYITSNKNTCKSEIAATLAEPKPKPQQNIDHIKRVKEIIKEEITDQEAQSILISANGDINIIKEKYRCSQRAAKITNMVGWLIDAIKKDYQPPISKVKVGKFNDYTQRQYDFDKLEKKLLGWK